MPPRIAGYDRDPTMAAIDPFSPSEGGTAVLERPRREALPARRRPSSGGPAPPSEPPDDDRGGGGGGGGDGGEGEWSPGTPRGAAELGLGLGLVSIGSLFAIFLAATTFVWRHAASWPPEGQMRVPRGLWVSSALLATCSLALVAAHRLRLRTREPERTRRRAAARWIGVAFLCGVSFLGAQTVVWQGMMRAGRLPEENAYLAIFYSLTGLHALHVLGGLAYLAALLWACVRPAPLEARAPWNSVRLCGVYWHFMAVIWALLFVALYLPKGAA